MDLSRLTQKELAGILRRVDRHVRWLEDQGLPSHGDGKQKYYVWDEVEPWWWEYRLKTLAGRSKDMKDIPERMVSEARKLAAEADITEMKAQSMKASLLDASEVEQAWSKYLSVLRGRLLNMSGTVAAQLVDGMNAAERKKVVDDALYLTLEVLSQGEGVADACNS